MINLIIIFVIHFIADFIFQSHEMSIKKSKSLLWLSYHVFVYTFVTIIGWLVFSPELITILHILLTTFITHWVTDFFTSKWSSYLYSKNSIHNFFVVIGFDQLIHATTLILTYNYLIKPIL
jgi:hypothetical protein